MRTGRPPKGRDQNIAQKVKTLAQYGISHNDIARIVDMDDETLRKYYADELAAGAAIAHAAVGKKLFEQCMAGNLSALTFYAKTRMGWRETNRLEVDAKVDISDVLMEARERVRKLR